MGRPTRLDAEVIVSEAIAVLQEGGIETVSLRNIAARLGVRAPSLARHVGDKAALVGLMSRRIFAEALDDIEPGQRGAEWLQAFGRALWRKQMATRDIAALLGAAVSNPESSRENLDRLNALMGEAGLSGSEAQLQQSAVQALVTGWVTFAKSARADQIAGEVSMEQRLEASMSAMIAGFGMGAR